MTCALKVRSKNTTEPKSSYSIGGKEKKIKRKEKKDARNETQT